MGKEILKFGNVEAEKHKFHQQKSLFQNMMETLIE